MPQVSEKADSAPRDSFETANTRTQSTGGEEGDGDRENTVVESDSLAAPAPAYEKVDSTSEKLAGKAEGVDEVKGVKTLESIARAAANDMVCAFGPETSFFYFPGETGLFWRFVNETSTSPATIPAPTISALKISRPYEVALSPYAAGYLAYRCLTGEATWSFIPVREAARPRKRKHRKAFYSAVEASKTLSSWLSQHVVNLDDIRNTKVRFGPAGRFMAWKPDGTWIANDLPPRLQTELKNRNCGTETKKMPRLVTFGIENAWAAIWDDGTHTVDLDGKYKRLDQPLQEFSGRGLLVGPRLITPSIKQTVLLSHNGS